MNIAVFLTGFLSGVALRSFVPVPQIMATALVLSSCVAGLYLYFISKNKKGVSVDRILVCIVLFLFALGVGVMRFNFVQNDFNIKKSEQGKRENSELFVGVIDEIPIKGEFNIQAKTKTETGYVLLRVKDTAIDLKYGDRIEADAICELPETFETDTGTVFDYPRYLMARGMHHVCETQEIVVLERGAGGVIREKLFALRMWFSGHIDAAFSNPHAGLVKGVLLGDKSGLGKDLKKDMTVAGVIHIAVLSGSNIALVAAIIFGFCKSLPYRIRIGITVGMVTLFVILSGAEPPALRAGILVAILFLGKLLHRELHIGRGLLVVATIMVYANPFALIYDMSFQLSFLATIGIVYVAPMLEKKFTRITERFGLKQIVAGTVGAQATVTPLLLHSTGAFSVASLPANILITWAVPILMSIGFFGGMLHVVSGFIAMPAVFLGEMVSGYIIWITELFAHMPYAQVLF